MILADGDIAKRLAQGDLIVDPVADDALQPSSLDIRLDHRFRIFESHCVDVIDPYAPQDITVLKEIGPEQHFVLHPGEFVLGSTLERVEIPDDLVARLEGKSSLGRLGLLIHSTAGYIDPGFKGNITLELSNVSNLPIRLYPGMFIGQLGFEQLSSPALRPYGSPGLNSKYSEQVGPVASAYHNNKRK